MKGICAALALLLVPVVTQAQVYKCAGENGRIAYQQMPCAQNQKPAEWNSKVGVSVIGGPAAGTDSLAAAADARRARERMAAGNYNASQQQRLIERDAGENRRQTRSLASQSGERSPSSGSPWHTPEFRTRSKPLTHGERIEAEAGGSRADKQEKPQSSTFFDYTTGDFYHRDNAGARNLRSGKIYHGSGSGPVIDPQTALPIPGQ